MLEIVHFVILYVISPEGELVRFYHEFNEPMTLWACGDFMEFERHLWAVYHDEINRWIMNNGSGYIIGHECVQDPSRME